VREFFLIIALMFAGTGCNSQRLVHAHDANDPEAQRHHEVQTQLEKRLRRIDREIETLEARALKDKGVAKLKANNHYYDQMAELEKVRTDTRQKFEELRRSTNEKWERLQVEAEAAADKLERSWNDIVRQTKKGS